MTPPRRSDEAALELAEATRARYAQPNGSLVTPRLLRRFNRRFWDALDNYEQVRTPEQEATW